MTFVSHAINFEDVLLWRALGHITNGFYIDVGANDPVEHSVTKAFYDKGWSGINIEPLPVFRKPLLAQRPRDVNLTIAAGAAEGEITLFDVPAVNGWATSDPQVAKAHREEGFELVEISVPMRTLASVCEEHVSGDIHFLKVDVEGFEAEVLRGMDFARWRPWVVMVEATLPNSRVQNHEFWEALVTDSGYKLAYFDGVNRYYIAIEHEELLPNLSVQPNVFDNFVSARLMNALESAEATWEREKQANANAAAQKELAKRSNELALKAKIVAHEATTFAQELEKQIAAIHQSASWRVTHPLRLLGHWASAARRQSGGWFRGFILWLMSRQLLRKLLLPQIQRFPAIERKLLNVAKNFNHANAAQFPPPFASGKSVELQNLSLSAQKIFTDLARACGINQHN